MKTQKRMGVITLSQGVARDYIPVMPQQQRETEEQKNQCSVIGLKARGPQGGHSGRTKLNVSSF